MGQTLVLQLEKFYKSAPGNIASSVKGLERESATFAISNEIRREGVIELPISHTTPVLLGVN